MSLKPWLFPLLTLLADLRHAGNSIAGTHTTSATTTLLFWNLLHNPESMDRCVKEAVDKLPDLRSDKLAYSVTEVEASLPFLRQCVRENFRTTPVFTMPLPRRVMAPEGMHIAGEHIEQGVSHLIAFKMVCVTKALLRPRLQFVTMHSTMTPRSGAPITMCLTQTGGSNQKMQSGPGISCTLALEGVNALARR